MIRQRRRLVKITVNGVPHRFYPAGELFVANVMKQLPSYYKTLYREYANGQMVSKLSILDTIPNGSALRTYG